MTKDLFGGLGGALGGLMGGLAKSGLVPKDTPEGKRMAAQSELMDLETQETEIFVEIGKQAFAQNPSLWPQAERLKLIQSNIALARATLDEAQRVQEAAEAEKAAEEAKGRCHACGHRNPEGVKFCQECGAKLGASFCVSCGAQLAPGTRFCGECGAGQEG